MSHRDILNENPRLGTEAICHMADGFSIEDGSGRYLFANDAFCALTGYGRDDLLGEEVPGLLTPRSGEVWSDEVNRRKWPQEFGEFICHRKDGQELPVQLRSFTMEFEGAEYRVSTIRDLTGRNLALRKIGRMQATLSGMVNAGDLALWDWTLDTGELTVSDSYFIMLGYPVGAWAPTWDNWRALVHPEDRPRLLAAIEKLLHDQVRYFDVEIRMQDAMGEWRWILSRGFVTERDETGHPTLLTGTQQDLHRIKTQERQVELFQRMEVMGQISSGVAHDFNNLLQILEGQLETLEDEVGTQFADTVSSMRMALDRAEHLTSSLLRYSRSEEPAAAPLDLGEFLPQAAALLSSALPSKIPLEIRPLDRTCVVKVDPRALETAILNLLINARDAMVGTRGKIVVEVTPEDLDADRAQRLGVDPGSYAVISVIDVGRGMPQDVVDRATEPLFTTKSAGQGTGLGLTMVHRFVGSAHGFMEIHSEIGEGTTVRLCFPMLEPAAMHPQVTAPDGSNLVGGSETVLVVDDEPGVPQLVGHQLERLGYKVHAVDNPRSALAILEQEPIDLLLTDIIMPYTMDGVHLAQRAIEMREDLPVVFMSGYVAEERAEAARSIGGFLPKPFRLKKLAVVIRGALDGVEAVGVRSR